MNKVLHYEAVKALILEGGYGCYRLYSLPGNELLGGSHLSSADGAKDSRMNSNDLVGHLEQKIEYLGDGDYRIALKATNATQNANEVNYRFRVVKDGGSAVQTVAAGFAGLGQDQVDKLVNERVAQALAVEREKQAMDRKIQELENLLKEMKSARFRKKKPEGWSKVVGNLGMMGAAVLIQEKWPKAVPLVEKIIAQMDNAMGDEEEEEEEETGFSLPE